MKDAFSVISLHHGNYIDNSSGVSRSRDSDFTDEGMKYLSGLPHWSAIELYGIPISDGGLKHLSELSNLSSLVIRNSQITDAGVEHLKKLTKLESLSLVGNQMTHACIENLKGMTNLLNLQLDQSILSEKNLADLRESLPECDIRSGF